MRSWDPKYKEKWFKDKNSIFCDIRFAAFDPSGRYLALGARHALLLVSVERGELVVVFRRRNACITAMSWDTHQVGAVVAFTDGVILNARPSGVSRSIWRVCNSDTLQG